MKVSSRPRSLPTLMLSAAALMFAACGAASSPSTGTGGTGGSSTGTGGTPSTGGVNGSGGTSSTGGSPGTGGTSSTGGVTGTGGSIATGGSGGSSSTGTGGVAGSGGHAGAAAGGHGGAATGGGGGTSSTGGGGSSGCPSNNTFCSGFEGSTSIPSAAIYMVNAAPGDPSRDFAIDTTQHHSGSASLLVKNQNASGSSGSAYRMLAVPGTAGAFWVRFWIQSDMPIGMTDHNAFAGGSIGSGPNDMMIEFAEDVGIAFNTSDQDVWPTGYGRLTGGGTMPYSLPAMTWACVEISYDGTNKHQQLFINGTQLIDATGYPGSALNLTYFKFGFDAYHGPARQVWFDDVAVAPARIGGCS